MDFVSIFKPRFLSHQTHKKTKSYLKTNLMKTRELVWLKIIPTMKFLDDEQLQLLTSRLQIYDMLLFVAGHCLSVVLVCGWSLVVVCHWSLFVAGRCLSLVVVKENIFQPQIFLFTTNALFCMYVQNQLTPTIVICLLPGVDAYLNDICCGRC